MIKYFITAGLPFIILIITGPVLIKLLKKLNYGQHVRGQGPESHRQKEGIPTMGGILIILGIVITSLLMLELNTHIIWTLIVTVGLGLVGLMDDLKQIRSQRSLGLKARYKISAQILIGLLLALYIFFYTDVGSGIIIPVTGEIFLLHEWIIPLIILTVVGSANAVNLTDGLDGLAAGVTAVTASSLAVINSFLNFNQLTLYSLIVTGACIGFIWYNSHPAQVFMGDVGSLALGGAIASLAVFSRIELFLLIIGGVYVIETLSVMIQVIYFRLSGGNRIFNMTPLHHHYELEGLDESKIVARFLILSLIFASAGLISFYMIL